MTDTYALLKSLHLLGVVLFLGNIIVTAWWKTMAARAARRGDPALLAGAGTGMVTAGGLDMSRHAWLAWGTGLFAAAGVLWGAVLIPVQIAQARMARRFAGGAPIPAGYWRLERLWMAAGLAATVLPLVTLWLMVTKPA